MENDSNDMSQGSSVGQRKKKEIPLSENDSENSPVQVVAQRSYAFYEGYDKEHGLHVYKLLTQSGAPEINRVHVGFREAELSDIFEEASPVWKEDPFLQRLPYFDEMSDYHSKGRFKVVEWDPEEYNMWRSNVEGSESEHSRDYRHIIGKGLRKIEKGKEDSLNRDDTDASGGENE